jgi:hypothetical protein
MHQDELPTSRTIYISKGALLLLAVVSAIFVGCTGSVSEDGYVRIAVSKRSYASSEDIEFEITVKEEKWIVLGGHCQRWFEQKMSHGWQEVGVCLPPDYEAMPWPIGDGETIQFAMPTTSPDNSHYVYTLTPGTYRLAITYSADQESITTHSPEFKIHE